MPIEKAPVLAEANPKEKGVMKKDAGLLLSYLCILTISQNFTEIH